MHKDNYYGRVRAEIMNYLPDKLDSLLDVGCGNGDTSFYIKNIYKCAYAMGIENNKNAYEKSSKILDRVINVDLDNIKNLPGLVDIQFNCILFLDILEHLKDPQFLLNESRKILKRDGTIIISIPNIRHYSILYDLIVKNDWVYQETGILDKTHMRFFTLNSMKRMIKDSGYKIIDYKSNKSHNKKFQIINNIFFKKFNKFSDFQYIFKCKKN